MLEIWASVEGRMLNLHRKRERFEHEIVVILVILCHIRYGKLFNDSLD